jgi:probable DNA metabolism protein
MGTRKTEIVYDGSIEGLFGILGKVCRGDPPPDIIRRKPGYALYGPPLSGVSPKQPDLFGESAEESPVYNGGDSPENSARFAAEFFEISAGAYDRVVHAWMSEFPIEHAIIGFARKVVFAAREAGERSPESRFAAERAAADRGDPDVAAVINAAWKVSREAERLRGLLRFSPAAGGVHIARCEPDHFTLPALAEHFSRRFGGIPWAIIDEKRRLVLTRPEGEEARILPLDPGHPLFAEKDLPGGDAWENLWRNYHRSINNESRNNPALQRQFMPARYWKYLPEMGEVRSGELYNPNN